MKINLHKLINLQDSAEKFQKKKEYKKAIKKYKKMLETFEDSDLHLKIADCYLNLSINDKNKEYYLNMAYHLSEAMALNNTLRKDPKNLIDLSYSYIYLGYLDQSKELLEELLEFDNISIDELKVVIGLLGYIEYARYKNISL